MINKNNAVIQQGGAEIMQIIGGIFALVIICLCLFGSCACSSWPADLDTFADGSFKKYKFTNVIGDSLSKLKFW